MWHYNYGKNTYFNDTHWIKGMIWTAISQKDIKTGSWINIQPEFICMFLHLLYKYVTHTLNIVACKNTEEMKPICAFDPFIKGMWDSKIQILKQK